MSTRNQVNPYDNLERFVARFETRTAAARELGISGQYLGDLIHGRRTFSERVLNALGLQRIIVKKAA